MKKWRKNINTIFVQSCFVAHSPFLLFFMMGDNCPWKSFRLIYSNTHLNSREPVPLNTVFFEIILLYAKWCLYWGRSSVDRKEKAIQSVWPAYVLPKGCLSQKGSDDIFSTVGRKRCGRGRALVYVPTVCTVSGAIFDGFLEVFWIFLKNERGKLKFHPKLAV